MVSPAGSRPSPILFSGCDSKLPTAAVTRSPVRWLGSMDCPTAWHFRFPGSDVCKACSCVAPLLFEVGRTNEEKQSLNNHQL
ncbi:hypothetical protein EJB05_16636, partial [Eragrostis curvula]